MNVGQGNGTQDTAYQLPVHLPHIGAPTAYRCTYRIQVGTVHLSYCEHLSAHPGLARVLVWLHKARVLYYILKLNK